MPQRRERSSEKKFVKTKGKKTRIHYFKGKAKKQHCAVCDAVLHGVAHSKRRNEFSKLSKTQKRPSVHFGGILCSNCRVMVVEETIKVKTGKPIQSVPFKIKSFVEMSEKQVEF